MPKKQQNERAFQTWIKSAWGDFLSQIHPGLSCDEGVPDLLLLTPSGLMPAEIKVGLIEGQTLWTEKIRPSQVAWHRRLADAGGSSFFITGVWADGNWRAFAFNGAIADQWETTGFKIGDTEAIELDTTDFYTSVADFLFRNLDV